MNYYNASRSPLPSNVAENPPDFSLSNAAHARPLRSQPRKAGPREQAFGFPRFSLHVRMFVGPEPEPDADARASGAIRFPRRFRALPFSLSLYLFLSYLAVWSTFRVPLVQFGTKGEGGEGAKDIGGPWLGLSVMNCTI